MASPASPPRKPPPALSSATAAIASPSRQMAKGAGAGAGGGSSGGSGGGSGSGRRKVSSREDQPLMRVQKQVRAYFNTLGAWLDSMHRLSTELNGPPHKPNSVRSWSPSGTRKR